MKILSIALAIIVNLLFIPAYSQTPNNMKIIVFGDSLSDVGNNSWIYATGTPITSFDVEGQKYNWVNYLAKKVTKTPAYSSNQGKHTTLFNETISYAHASADTSNTYLSADWPQYTPVPQINSACTKPGLLLKENVVIGTCVPGLLKQVELYLSDVKNQPPMNTVFLIWSGANDFFYKLPLGESPEKIITGAVTNIVQAKNNLLRAGVSPQQIYVMNLPDLSKTPFAIKNNLKLTELTVAFNINLKYALTASTENNTPIPANHIISMFDLLNDIVNNPAKFNVTNTTESCADNMKTPLCEGYLFYDLKHPTANIHKVIADYVSKTLS